MAKRPPTLPEDIINEMLELSEEEESTSETSAEEEYSKVSVGTTAGTSGTATGFPHRIQELHVDSDSEIDNSEVEEGDEEGQILPSHSSVWVESGRARPRFPARFETGIKGNLVGKVESLEIFEHFIDEEICNYIAEQTNLYAQQMINEKTLHKKMKRRSRDKDWVDTNREEIKLFLGVLLLQGVIHKPTLSSYYSRNRLLATPIFYEIMSEKRFFLLLRFLHFADNKSYSDAGRVSPKMYKIKPFFDHCIRKFSESYIPEGELSIDESLLLWKGRLGWKVYIPKKRSRFGMESYKLCEAKSGYVWNMMMYTGKDTELVKDVGGADVSSFTKPSRVVLTLAEKLLNQGYLIGLDNYYSSPELYEFLNSMGTDAVGTVRVNRKDLPKSVMNKKLKQGEIAAAFRNKLMALKWKDKRDVCILSSVHDASTKTVRDRKGNSKKKPIAIIDYNDSMGGVDLSDQYMVTYSTARKRMKKYYQKIFRHLLDLCVFNSYVIYRKNGGKDSHLKFRLDLIHKMLHKYGGATSKASGSRSKIDPPLRLSGRHFPQLNSPTATKKHAHKRCVVCLSHKQRRETIYSCRDCNVPLCAAPCFQAYHTKMEY